MFDKLAYAHGQPQYTGEIKQTPEDFIVKEDLGFDLTGEGEHVCVRVQKKGENTAWVAKQFAKKLGISPRNISWAGLKDRHATTEQWFSIHLPGKPAPDSETLEFENISIVEMTRHNKKIKTGALRGNWFQIRLANIASEAQDDINARLKTIMQQGVPNYFGPQRFGHGLANLKDAKAMFEGARVNSKHKRSLFISAARSWVFNTVVSQRFIQQKASTLLTGDCVLLKGSRSFFHVDVLDDVIQQRYQDGDVLFSAPLWGKDHLPSTADGYALEQAAIEQCDPVFIEGLASCGLRQERRALWLMPSDLTGQWQEDDSLVLNFYLPAGCFATSVVRELILTEVPQWLES